MKSVSLQETILMWGTFYCYTSFWRELSLIDPAIIILMVILTGALCRHAINEKPMVMFMQDKVWTSCVCVVEHTKKHTIKTKHH